MQRHRVADALMALASAGAVTAYACVRQTEKLEPALRQSATVTRSASTAGAPVVSSISSMRRDIRVGRTSTAAVEPSAVPALHPIGGDPATGAMRPAPLPPAHEDPTPAAMADSVSAAFRHAWEGYRRYAWAHDELKPLSRSAHDWYGASLLMTPVDGYDTMLLMGLDSAAAQAANLIRQRLTFDRDTSVQVFEVTIRLLGGLLSGYEMNGDTAFLRLARDLADRLMPAFRSSTGMPYRYVNLHTGRPSGPVSNPAEIGTLMLEFGTLTRLTGDSAYYRAAKRAITQVFEHRSRIGLVGSGIDVRTGEWTNPDASLSAYIDSYYEYLLKSWLLFGDPDFKRMWDVSFGPVKRYLLDARPDGLWAGHADMRTGARTATHFGALDAFVPGLLVLAGDTADAAALMQSVDRMWTAFDLEPEVMDYASMTVVDPFYPLRPEAIESAYYLWHFTRDERYRAMGWDMFQRLQRWARTDAGYASIKDVRTKEHADEMPSFLLAETFKYAYLLFAPDSTLRLDDVVFNTEAHPLRRRAPLVRAFVRP